MVTSLRLRLAVWYAGLLALILVATSFVSYSFHSISHYDDIDRSLASTAIHVRGAMGAQGSAVDADGALKVPSFEEHTSPEIFVHLYDAGWSSHRLLPQRPRWHGSGSPRGGPRVPRRKSQLLRRRRGALAHPLDPARHPRGGRVPHGARERHRGEDALLRHTGRRGRGRPGVPRGGRIPGASRPLDGESAGRF